MRQHIVYKLINVLLLFKKGTPAPPPGGDVRITEDSQVRIIEDGNRRITEGN